MGFSSNRFTVALMTILSLALSSSAYADAAGAKKSIDEAQEHVKKERWVEAETTLSLAEAEMDDATAAEKTALEKTIAAVRKSAEEGKAGAATKELKRRIEQSLDNARREIANARAAEDRLRSAEEILNSEDGKKYIKGTDRTTYEKDIATKRKVTGKAIAEMDAADVENRVKRAEDKQPEVTAAFKEENPTERSEVRSFEQDLDGIAQKLKELPDTNPKKADLVARHKKMADGFSAAVGKASKADVLTQLKRSRETYEEEWKGWEQETDSPTWEQYMKESSPSMAALQQEKTVKFVDRANQFLKDTADNDRVKALNADPDVKAFIDGVTKQRDAAVAKLVKSIEKLLDGAEKAPLNQDNALAAGHFKENIRINLDGAPQQEALQARAQAISDKFSGSEKEAEKAAEAEVAQRIDQAAKNWPDMVASLGAAPLPDLQSVEKGKLYTLKDTQNRAGAEWDSGGEYDFIVAKNGKPIAAKFDPAVRAALDDSRNRLNYSVDDVEEIVIEIVGTCNVQQREYSRLFEKWQPTFQHANSPLGRVVAYRQGPTAVVVGKGGVRSVSATGAVDGVAGGSAPLAAAGAGGGAGVWLWRILTLLVGLTAAAAALAKANFAPIANVPQVGNVRTKLGDANFAYLGLGIAVLGLIWLLKGLFFYGVLTSLAIIAAGLYVALDFLVAKGLVKEPIAAKIRPLGVPIGLACAALAVLSLLTAGMLRII
jgi:hypothetical protein